MTSAKQLQIVKDIQRLQKEVAELRERKREVLLGASSANVSAGSGSKSYSNWTPEKFDAAIADDLAQISAYKRVLAERSSLRIGQVKIVRC